MKWLATPLCWLIISAGQAGELTVIYDSGDTLPMAPYLPESPTMPATEKPNTEQSSIKLPFQLPITTPSLQPGTVKTTLRAFPLLQQPVFLVGSDPLSQDWLQTKRDQLANMGAVGLLIEAETPADIETMVEIAAGLRLVPAPGESIAQQLGLTHYPVLISREGWEQ